jgi:hypothetical protein
MTEKNLVKKNGEKSIRNALKTDLSLQKANDVEEHLDKTHLQNMFINSILPNY